MKNQHPLFIDSLRAAFAILVLIGLGACASAPPEVTHYLLRPPPKDGSGPIDGPIRAGLGRVVVAPYLQSTHGIQLETQDGEMRPAVQYQWAEPLDAGLRWYLRSEVGARLGHQIGGGLTDRREWDYTVDVFVARLHGTMTGSAILEASFIVRGTANAAGERFEYRFSESIPLPEEGYAGVVQAETALLSEFAGRIADVLRERITLREMEEGA